MKNILSLLGTITLIGTSTTNLVTCNAPQYTKEELKKIKDKNKINTTNETIKNNLEWIAPQEKPFNKVDNKYYYIVWKGKNWNITKFKNNEEIIPPNYEYIYKIIEEKEEYKIQLRYYSHNDTKIDLIIFKSINEPTLIWEINNNDFIKSVYRWNGEEQNLPDLIIDKDCNIQVN
ncbi:hypothetical protein [Spiroplasma endosymbiont of Polydrusus formosus]|uniref:hypothetical protein n=1 Tax=Spiroplasma endosymbiont of Polydrusus formosus TaxID=3139326 RepID=UPI0035B551CF